MIMKSKTVFVTLLLLCCIVFAGCGSSQDDSSVSASCDAAVGDCYISFEDGEYYELPVEAYGKEFVLPESMNEAAGGDFYGWIGMDGVYQPGDSVVAEEFMSFTALYSLPDMGTVFAMDTVRGGYCLMSSEEEMQLGSPYENYEDGSYDDFFDCWEDESGNTYEGGACVTVKKGDVLILHAVYSTEHSAAYLVDVHYNTGNPDFDSEYHRYVKKGASIPLCLMIEPAGYCFEGWYDHPEGGTLMGNETDAFTPVSDISLYGHWAAAE